MVPKWRSRSTSATRSLRSSASNQAQETAVVVVPTPPRLPTKTITCPNPPLVPVPVLVDPFSKAADKVSRVAGLTR